MQRSTQEGVRKAFYYIGRDLVAESKKLILKVPKSGRIYRLRKNGRIVLHQASAPGEPPANFTGALKSSLDFNVIGADRMEYGAREQFLNKGGSPVNLKTRKGVVYARRLELGDSKVKKRPFLLPSIKTNYKNIREHFEREIKKSIKEGSS